MEWTIGWWRISVQRVWPTSKQLTQMYNQAAPNWHRLIQRLGVSRAYIKLFQSLQQSATLDHLKDNSIICDCGVGTGAFSLALVKTVITRCQIKYYSLPALRLPKKIAETLINKVKLMSIL